MLPATLQRSAVPRWSHRDPVEGDNPFSADDPRRAVWSASTDDARQSLIDLDAGLAVTAEVTLDPGIYRRQLLDLAVARFDIWAQRVAHVVFDSEDLSDYAGWLADYATNWLYYLTDTCPHVDARDELQTRLAARAKKWLATARISIQH